MNLTEWLNDTGTCISDVQFLKVHLCITIKSITKANLSSILAIGHLHYLALLLCARMMIAVNLQGHQMLPGMQYYIIFHRILV